jgi:hypothetical protein
MAAEAGGRTLFRRLGPGGSGGLYGGFVLTGLLFGESPLKLAGVAHGDGLGVRLHLPHQQRIDRGVDVRALVAERRELGLVDAPGILPFDAVELAEGFAVLFDGLGDLAFGGEVGGVVDNRSRRLPQRRKPRGGRFRLLLIGAERPIPRRLRLQREHA